MKKILLSAVAASLLWLIIPSAHALMIKIIPETTNTVDTGNIFNATVNVEAAADLAGFQFEIAYNTDVVIVTGVVFGSFLESSGRTVVAIPGMPDIDNDSNPGRLTCVRVTSGTAAGVYGSGTLATITFQVKSLSDDVLKIENASLTDTKSTVFSVTNGNLSTADGTVQPRYHISASAETGGGSITPSGDVLVKPGGSQCFSVQPAACYHIVKIIADGAAVSQYCFDNVAANHSIQAYFEINSFIIDASAGTGGKISPSGVMPVTCGQSVTFDITPDDCYHVADVIVDGVSQGAINPYTLTVSRNHTIQAIFEKDPVINASAGAGGKTAPTGAVCVKPGENKTFSIIPDKGFRISDVKVDDKSEGRIAEYTFEKITADRKIHADFYPAVSGDIDGNDTVNLADAILGLRILAGIDFPANQTIMADADVNGDSRIGIEEVLYILQKVASLREYDAISILQILAGLDTGEQAILKVADINGDGKIGLEEVIYILQKMSGLKV